MERCDLCLCVGAKEIQERNKEMGKTQSVLRSIDCWEAKRPDGKATGAEQKNAAHDALRAPAAVWNKGRISSSSQGARGCRGGGRADWPRSGGGMVPVFMWKGRDLMLGN